MSQFHEGPDSESPPSTPRWVKIFGIVALALILLIGVVMLTGGAGGHGPVRHTLPSGLTVHSLYQL